MKGAHVSNFLGVGLVLTFLTSLSSAENWPTWRGPNHDGISSASNVPTNWGPDENIAWRVELPGQGGSTPVVWKDTIFLTSADGEDVVLMAISSDGQKRWQRRISSGNKPINGDEGNMASPSPTTDGEHVWAMSGIGELACFDFAGSEVWRVDLQERYGDFDIAFGMSSSPILHEDRLFLQLLHTGGQHVVALDKATGDEIWHVTRSTDARAECEHSYASPTLYLADDLKLLITHGADYTVAHRLSDGQEVWRLGELNPKSEYNPTLRFVASPLAVNGLVVVPSAKNGPVVGVDPRARGDISADAQSQLWRRPNNTPDVPSPLVVDGRVYLCRENGILICLDSSTGEEIYLESFHRQRHRASPVYADGKIYLTARDGRVTVVQAGPDFEILAKNDLNEPIAASPAIVDGRIYLRTYQALYAVQE